MGNSTYEYRKMRHKCVMCNCDLPEDDPRTYCQDCYNKRQKERQKQESKPATLCWTCINSVPINVKGHYLTGCPWSMRFEPVEGWTAEEREYRTSYLKNDKKLITYLVRECPMFFPSDRKLEAKIRNEKI